MPTTLKRRLSKVDAMETSTSENIDTAAVDATTEKIFSNMRLRRILKENHGQDITELAFCFDKNTTDTYKPVDPEDLFQIHEELGVEDVDASNVLGTVGGAQINVYDNEHFGHHLDIMSNFNLASELTEDQDYEEKVLNTFSWMYKKTDTLVATGGADGDIHILSVALSKEIAILKGHTKQIIDIKTNPHDQNHILSVSKDGTIRLWNTEKRRCMVVFQYDCSVVCFSPSGETFITGTSKGELREWKLPDLTESMDEDEDDEDTQVVGKGYSRILKKMHGDCSIDCIRYANGNVLSKSTNGRMEYWDPATEETIRSFRVKTGENQSRFDVTLNGDYFCVGTNHGTVFIYSLKTGKLVTELSHRRSTKPIFCCVFSRDHRQILCGGPGGFLWRFDYIEEDVLKKWDDWTK
ncbi:hypothetical protein [Absidia glauca]|uniref:Uncharacterized protein n=1 Tax=Absidia glauca TaxID=4829 RepID=A0A163KA19_ABSGL|nr:hypothetical protein [Absidia glauca]